MKKLLRTLLVCLPVAGFVDDLPTPEHFLTQYLNSLSRVEAKGSPEERRAALRQLYWVNKNYSQLKQLLEWELPLIQMNYVVKKQE